MAIVATERVVEGMPPSRLFESELEIERMATIRHESGQDVRTLLSRGTASRFAAPRIQDLLTRPG
jgi:hypothetical protein